MKFIIWYEINGMNYIYKNEIMRLKKIYRKMRNLQKMRKLQKNGTLPHFTKHLSYLSFLNCILNPSWCIQTLILSPLPSLPPILVLPPSPLDDCWMMPHRWPRCLIVHLMRWVMKVWIDVEVPKCVTEKKKKRLRYYKY